MLNELIGWILITLGFLSGGVIGMLHRDEQFLGGYASPRRRLVRLGHIAFVALGILNLLFVVSMERAGLTEPGIEIGLSGQLASWGFIVGGFSMPIACGLNAWQKKLFHVFTIPVVSLVMAGVLTAMEVAS